MQKNAPWTRPVRGARRALASCERVIGEVRRVLRISDRFGTARPIRAHHHFLRAGTWLVEGSDKIARAVAYLKIATSLVAAEPGDAAGAPEAILETTRRLVEVSAKLHAVTERLTWTSHRLAEAAAIVGHGLPFPPSPRPMPPRNFLLPAPEPINLNQRERPPPPALEDAFRRVSRGRAPPSFVLPLCSRQFERKEIPMSNDNEVKVSHTEAAQALIETIRGMRGTIPNFVIPTLADRWRLNRAASVPAEFIEMTVVAVKNNPVLVRGGASSDPETVRDQINFAEAYAPVAQELEALAKFLRHSTKAARANAGNEALLTYAVTQRLAKRPETADLVPVRDAMRQTLGAKRSKAQTTPVTPPTPPATPEPPANGS